VPCVPCSVRISITYYLLMLPWKLLDPFLSCLRETPRFMKLSRYLYLSRFPCFSFPINKPTFSQFGIDAMRSDATPTLHSLKRSLSTHSSRAKCCSRHGVRLSGKKFETRNPVLTLFLANPRYNAEATLKNKLFIYGKYITLLIQFVNVVKVATP